MEVCEAAGRRLCTEGEIIARRRCCEKGCGFDATRVWTSDDCTGEFLSIPVYYVSLSKAGGKTGVVWCAPIVSLQLVPYALLVV